jgi:hypothetical protein
MLTLNEGEKNGNDAGACESLAKEGKAVFVFTHSLFRSRSALLRVGGARFFPLEGRDDGAAERERERKRALSMDSLERKTEETVDFERRET